MELGVASVKDLGWLFFLLIYFLHTGAGKAREVAGSPLRLRPALRGGEQAQSRGNTQLTHLNSRGGPTRGWPSYDPEVNIPE